MAETSNTAKATKKNWFKGMAAEFKKIIWPDKETIAKESTAVIIFSLILALLIVGIDFLINAGLGVII